MQQQRRFFTTAILVPVLLLAASGCAPTFQRCAVPDGTIATPESWRPARPGADIRFTTAAGDRYEGTILAVGDSLRVDVRTGPGLAVQSFPRTMITRAEVRQQAVPGEGTWGAVLLGLFAATAALYLLPWDFPNN